MPQKKSAKEELKKSLKRHGFNLARKKAIKDSVKKFRKSIESKDFDSAAQTLKTVYKTLDKAAAKKTIHPNKAARKKSRYTAILTKSKS